jgi:YHS domain-containing protein
MATRFTARRYRARRRTERMATTTKDPVCGMEVDPTHVADRTEHEGQTYLFCSATCKGTFEKDPDRYIKK